MTTEEPRSGRWVGEANPKAKLGAAEVEFIRRNYHRGLGYVFAAKFNVSRGTVLRIAHNRTWRYQEK
jgi:hypothetical protein